MACHALGPCLLLDELSDAPEMEAQGLMAVRADQLVCEQAGWRASVLYTELNKQAHHAQQCGPLR